MSSWNSICRVCTSPAEYEIFEKIPAYLHASSNEFLNWQKNVNVLLEETTGLKCSENDGLPNKICALCISYLKHAVFFREQCINNALTLKAIAQMRQQSQKNNSNKRNLDKENVLITEQDLNFTYERHVDTNLLNSNISQDQDKVCKQLLNNNFQANASAQQNIEQQLRYLNLLFNKDSNSGLQARNRRNDGAGLDFDIASGDPYAEEEFPSATSSDENEASEITPKHSIFSYKEKNFEEDDIMDIDELRDAITINIPESCKERKCRACSRRFMFEDSFNEHMSTCIEYKFLTYIEEINKLLYIRRNKGISPHEFVRRMIFCIRKTCEWLKKANCGDMLLPDLVQNGSNAEENNKTRLESEGKSSAASSGEQKLRTTQTASAEKSRKRYDLPKHDKLTDLLTTTNSNACEKNATNNDVVTESSLVEKRKTERNSTGTPITISNNILYEIERSQSRSSNLLPLLDLEMDLEVKKPIAILAARNSTTNVTTYAAPNNYAASGGNVGKGLKDSTERLTFLQKLQQAANQQSPTFVNAAATPATPQISVRKDLMTATPSNRQYTTSPIAVTPKSIPITPLPRNVSFSARCNPCNLLFETLAALEVHNAMYHNHMPVYQAKPPAATLLDEAEREAERKRIIALFEDEDDEGELE
ncbi:uncharacterized protein LOC118741129 [Rhagoletis pomonella]|uniref:uncharacterized protein LOC118741129 n=1 Tax=Rhagoletis pomonella TaxID=28610 RepID=UPI001781482B|nr:uncharacterized protein LOC118741129 [Rhagoletis pomonella]